DVSEDYLEEFRRAEITFLEHIVYDPIKKQRVHFSGKNKLSDNNHYNFLGIIDHENPHGHALGKYLSTHKGPIDKVSAVTEKAEDKCELTHGKLIIPNKKRFAANKNNEKAIIIIDENLKSNLFDDD
ncbi:hypothetical protein EDEG_02656, partial [Edhazardia aedis USNM 41457]